MTNYRAKQNLGIYLRRYALQNYVRGCLQFMTVFIKNTAYFAKKFFDKYRQMIYVYFYDEKNCKYYILSVKIS